jgi:uroporphyrinogen-III synthase
VIEVIEEMAAGRVDLIAFTSTPQVRRMQQVAKANQSEETLRQGLLRTTIAAVGPIVARAIEEAGGRVSIAPSDNFHMKPMVNEIIAAFN